MTTTRARLVLAVALTMLGACGRLDPITLLPNQPPTVEFTSAPAASSTIGNYSYDLRWAGRDSDGRIEYFQYAIDPPGRPGTDTVWTTTRLNRHVFTFSADSLTAPGSTIARRYHTVVLRAFDDRGGASAPVWISFTASNILPSIKVTSPQASKLLAASVAPDFHVTWIAEDPDGRSTHVPVSIRYRLIGPSTVPNVETVVLFPDTLMTLAAPEFTGWDSLPGSATGLDLHGLQPNVTYLLAVVAFDEAGAFSAPFNLEVNLLRFSVSAAAAVGPALTVKSNYFTVTYDRGGFYSAPSTYFRVEIPADRQAVFEWTGRSNPGTFITGYRWAVDLTSLSDETARSDEDSDLSHWSQWQLGTQATLPAVSPSTGGATHTFYLEARDNVGSLGLVVVVYTAVTASLERDLLIVDDTRFTRDVRLATGCVQAPRGTWPTASELDTFLFARGGKPWKCYPAGTLSTPGLFTGYAYDSLVTFSPGAGLPLSKLSHYRNIIWMVNGDFVLSNDVQLQFPLLRQLSQPFVTNSLLIWLGLGGRLWIMGGGVATATQIDYEAKNTPRNVYSSDLGELVAGRFMFNYPHWRSEITEDRTNGAVRSARAVGGWPGAPDYARLPERLEAKTTATDDPAPNRTNPSDFYRTVFIAEYLSKPNRVFESDFATGAVSQVLDTLYETQGGVAGNGKPIMTLYHGADAPGLLFSGFPIWYFQRPQALELIDWVLQHYWGLSRSPVSR